MLEFSQFTSPLVMWQPETRCSDPSLCCVWLVESPNSWALNLALRLPQGHAFHKLLSAPWCGRHTKKSNYCRKQVSSTEQLWFEDPPPTMARMKHGWMVLQSESLLTQSVSISSHLCIFRPASWSEQSPHLLLPLPFFSSDDLNTSLACWIPPCCLLLLECLPNCFTT